MTRHVEQSRGDTRSTRGRHGVDTVSSRGHHVRYYHVIAIVACIQVMSVTKIRYIPFSDLQSNWIISYSPQSMYYETGKPILSMERHSGELTRLRYMLSIGKVRYKNTYFSQSTMPPKQTQTVGQDAPPLAEDEKAWLKKRWDGKYNSC